MEHNRAPELSVVLATYNRAETMKRTLRHLAEQTLAPERYEVVVIDDGSPDDTQAVVTGLLDTLPYHCTYTRHDNQGPGYTINRGIERARAPLVLVMADDIFFEPEALEAHLEMHLANPEEEVAVLGKVIDSPELNDSVFMRHWDPFQFKELDGASDLPYYRFWGCNVSAKKSFLVAHGMWRDQRGRGGAAAHEDVEVGWRLSKHGLRLCYCEKAFGYHYHPYTLDQAFNRYFQRGVNWDEFRTLVPDPEFVVFTHLLTPKTAKEYFRVVRSSNSLFGKDRYVAWHVLRETVRSLLFNRLTVPMCWEPLMRLAEKHDGWLGSLMNTKLYSAVLFYHFVRGIRYADEHFEATPSESGVAPG